MDLEPESICHRHILLTVKVLSVIACLIAFITNSSAIFIQFIDMKTITSQDVEHNNELLLPSITMCSLSGFKEEMDEFKDLELENYLNKTLDLEEILGGYYDFDNTNNSIEDSFVNLTTMKANTALWKFTTTYSQFQGRCHTLSYRKPVRQDA